MGVFSYREHATGSRETLQPLPDSISQVPLVEAGAVAMAQTRIIPAEVRLLRQGLTESDTRAGL